MLDRRRFTLGLTATAFAGALGACTSMRIGDTRAPVRGYGPLEADPAGLLDLPRGFGYRTTSAFGDRMNDGLIVPDRADGTGCFALENRRVALARNHEIQARHLDAGPFRRAASGRYTAHDRNAGGDALPGGTTTIVYDPASGRVERQHLSLASTGRWMRARNPATVVSIVAAIAGPP